MLGSWERRIRGGVWVECQYAEPRCGCFVTDLGCSEGVAKKRLKIGDACRLAKLVWLADSRVARRALRVNIDAILCFREQEVDVVNVFLVVLPSR